MRKVWTGEQKGGAGRRWIERRGSPRASGGQEENGKWDSEGDALTF